jgi:hypothetical protein
LYEKWISRMKFIGDLLHGDDDMIRSDEKTWERF